jgi:hypothetical protein
MGTRGRNTVVPGEEVPEDCSEQGREYHYQRYRIGSDNTFSDGAGYRGASECAHKVEERRQIDRGAEWEDPSAYHRRDRISRVMEAVDKVEQERDQHYRYDETKKHFC